ncbi:MAG: chromosome segregation protein SMC [Lachnospiraceae bacterium]|jgi:chromosome segregation protein|nr:chromosome segregation protein SMC [Lachnospiraceae bacterium]
MFLKTIEVQGFKSFAHKIKFDFHNGITAIVGPNGSGKSNVADAVRWVLGEQRVKQLRGGNMQDVIFAGTENRKPLSYAYVSITLDNSDHELPIEYEEITVTRKLYRSGESEYLINGNICRLKEVYELFYDTGIGREGYSLIGQGQVDKILSGKPEERRELFDEAAGIVKFKRRKNITLKKLEEEKQSMLRLSDILAELERQVGPLAKQAETAKIFLNKREELRTYDINMFLMETDRIANQLKQIKEKHETTENELSVAKEQYSQMKNEYESVEEQTDSVEQIIENAQQQRNKTMILKQQLENSIELLKEQIRSARHSDEHYDQRARAIEAEISQREDELKNLESDREEMRGKLKERENKKNSVSEALISLQMKNAAISSDIDSKKKELLDLVDVRGFAQAESQKYDTMIEQTQVRKNEAAKRLNVLAIEEEKRLVESRIALEELEAVSGSIIEIHDKIKRLEKEEKSLSEKSEIQKQIISKLQYAFHQEQSKYDSLRNMAERYEGFGNSIKKVMERKEKDPKILGVVADLIQVDSKYETALETALGGSLQNIVTKDEQTAKKMVGYLKENKFGRATFLPLSTVRNPDGFRRPEALKEKGVVGTANTLVNAGKEYKDLVDYLLGRTVVTVDMDAALSLARKFNQSLRIVTLGGELIMPGGAITGGAFRNSQNLLSRKREMDALESKVDELRKELAKEQEEAGILQKKTEEIRRQRELIQEDLQDLYVKQTTAKMNSNQAEELAKSAKEQALELRNSIENLDLQITEIAQNQESIHVDMDASKVLGEKLQTEINGLQIELDALKEEEAALLKDSEEAQVSYANSEKEFDFIDQNVRRIQEETEKFKKELDELEISKGGSSQEITDKENEIEKLQNTVDESQEIFIEIDNAICEAKKQRELLHEQNKEFLKKREDMSNHISNLEKEQIRLEGQQTSFEESREALYNHMWEDYELTYSQATELKNPNLTDLAKMKRQINNLRSEIKALGEVNVNAIEDYKSVSERYEFHKTQIEDIEGTKEKLESIIADLDEAMRKQFGEQFSKMAEEFDVVFKELFEGGKATLELIEDEDVLEAGIRIIAQPPGKKLQNMMQLSGGEKALTAIALLFAIQNLKPSPFCLLDEIEAALDDNNVVRFSKYLHKLSKNTQFIVITHRKGTMTSADRLYGITMQEKGVSTLVSVSLIEEKLDE